MRHLLCFLVISFMVLASCSDSNYSARNKSRSSQKKTSYAKHYNSKKEVQIIREVLQKQDRIEQMFTDMEGMLREEEVQ